jgi:hypothetical protein
MYQPKSPKPNRALLCSFMTHHAPEWTVREKVFVEDMNPDGSPDTVSAIAVSFKHLSSEPSGLSFIYKSGKKQTLGYWGEKPQIETLQENEKLMRLEIGISQGHKMGHITVSFVKVFFFFIFYFMLSYLGIHIRRRTLNRRR